MKPGICKHYTSVVPLNGEPCKAGVDVRAHVGGDDLGWLTRVPCIRMELGSIKPNGPIHPCDKYEEPSAEDIAEHEAAVHRMVENMRQAGPLIWAMKEEFKGRSGFKEVECPVCGGKLGMSIASINGHVWGRCETDGCLGWME